MSIYYHGISKLFLHVFFKIEWTLVLAEPLVFCYLQSSSSNVGCLISHQDFCCRLQVGDTCLSLPADSSSEARRLLLMCLYLALASDPSSDNQKSSSPSCFISTVSVTPVYYSTVILDVFLSLLIILLK
jgi:hypothetical protein